VNFRIVRRAHACWQGSLADGSGRIGLDSGAFEGPYSLRGRIEDSGSATNPEEMLGAAEAACFTMSLANLLTEAGHPARDLRTSAAVTLASRGGSFDITQIALTAVGDVPGIDRERFADLASQAKNCTISRALTGTEITLEANLTVG